MTLLWQAVHVGISVLGVAYLTFPARIHTFGFEFLRRSPSEEFGASDASVWFYRGIGALLVFIGVTGLVRAPVLNMGPGRSCRRGQSRISTS